MSEQDADTPEERHADESGTAEKGATDTDGSNEHSDETADKTAGDDAGVTAGESDPVTGEEVDPETADEALDEIAEEPEGDLEAELAAIVGERETDEEGDTPGGARRVDTEEVTPEDSLVEDVRETSARTVARAIEILRAEIEAAEAELDEQHERADDLESRLRRKQADFQNYKKRQKRRMEDEKQRATEDLVTRLLDVRDNLQRALDQDEGVDIRDGVASTLDQFDQQLDRENVERIEPDSGDDVDPQRHEVLATIASDQPEDAIAHIHRPGYEMGGKVLRPAQVAVSDGSGNNSGTDNSGADSEAESDESGTDDETEQDE